MATKQPNLKKENHMTIGLRNKSNRQTFKFGGKSDDQIEQKYVKKL